MKQTMGKAKKVGKKPKADKASKAGKKPKADNKPQKDKKQCAQMVFGIRNKIIICFLVPIIFMIALGIMSYQKAADGMSEAFCDSTQQTINMASEYVDVIASFIEAEALTYSTDTDLGKYLRGTYSSSAVEVASYASTEYTTLLASKLGNSYISDIHLIPQEDYSVISTTNKSPDGFYDEYMEEMEELSTGSTLTKWVDHHDVLDSELNVSQDDYILVCQLEAQTSKGVFVIDMDSEAVLEFLEGLDLGDGSIIGFVTSEGRELISWNTAEEEDAAEDGTDAESGDATEDEIAAEDGRIFADKDFYLEADEETGAVEVKFQGDDYLFFRATSDTTGATVCALVPMEIVTGQAESIKNLSIVGVLVASVIVILIGAAIAAGIRKNMTRISGSLKVVAQGNLATEVSVKGRDEFRGLAAAANNMIANNKKLVQQVSKATDKLAESAGEVTEESGIIQEYSRDITQAINEINEGMEKQSVHAQECVRKTDTLSAEIQEVNTTAQNVEKLVESAEQMIQRGMELVELLGNRASETTEVTAKVEESIEELKRESETINQFVGMITDISEQTNLLSLNASIEAARAGEAGRGFAVVAEEIRKLADNSAQAAGEIRNNVEHISAQTSVSVNNAKQAGSMVALQTEAVEEVTDVFRNMNDSMEELFAGLKEILVSTERADKEREETLEAVKNISHIIEETAASAEVVRNVATSLQQNVDSLNGTAENLGDNMNGLRTEISVFKTE